MTPQKYAQFARRDCKVCDGDGRYRRWFSRSMFRLMVCECVEKKLRKRAARESVPDRRHDVVRNSPVTPAGADSWAAKCW